MNSSSDVNVNSYELLPTPREVKNKIPLTVAHENLILDFRKQFENILDFKDPRLVVVVGPCSIHDVEAGLEYANALKKVADEVKDEILVVMRVYFTKPRTTTGWKGLINDPHLNDSFSINNGLFIARKFLVDITEIGLPAATEALDAIVPQYMDDLISWNAIGARTTESQTHREMASGLSSPVGFKNGTDGSIQVAINAIEAASKPHHFLGIDTDGRCAVLNTKGNPYTHLVLRGGITPNYDKKSIEAVKLSLEAHKLPKRIMVDCSHGNSLKDFTKQEIVFKDCINQRINGSPEIFGLMLESNINEGKQNPNSTPLKYGVSITDACLNIEKTVELLRFARDSLRK